MKRGRGGFTLTEMLTAVGILVVLLAVAIPAIITLRGNLKMRELDDTAREIFLAAQNSLTARKAAGTPTNLGEKDDNFADCYWLSSTDDGAKTLLPAGSIEGVAAGNHYMICYNAKTATVLEVYYAEHSLDAGKIKNMDYSDHYTDPTHKTERRQEQIGYYNGGDLERGDIVSLLPPLLTITNGEKLTVTVTVSGDKALEYTNANIMLTVTVEELDQNGAVVSENRKEFSQISPINGKRELTLDSLTEGRFQDICKGITPGTNIRVTATLSGPTTGTAGGTTTYLSASSASAVTNSLYADRAVVNERDTLRVACARHLQNLAPAVSGVPVEITQNYYAEQTAEITWPSGLKFQPICNTALRAYNGNGNGIAGLNIDCSDAVQVTFEHGSAGGDRGAGLFAFVENAELTNIRLIDPVLTGSAGGTGHVGALAGVLRKSTVSRCQVYATGSAAGIDGTGQSVGGLIGLALDDYVISGSSASLPRIRSGSNGAYLGGLIGRVKVNTGYTTGSVSGCYADTGWMGGDKKWDEHYGIQGNSAWIGGLIGGTWNYAGVNQVTDCYALGWYSGGREGKSVGTLVGLPQGTYRISDCYSILQSGEGNRYYIDESSIRSLAELSAFRWSDGSAGASVSGSTTAYHKDICRGDYPYPMLDLHHYGDWPVQTVDGIKLTDGETDDSTELFCIQVPAGRETAEFYASARNGDALAMQEVTAATEGGGVTNATAVYSSETGYTKVTFPAPKDPCVTYVDLTAEECTLRAVVVVYRATVTLTGKNASMGTGLQVEGTASTDGTCESGTLILRTEAKVGTFTAKVDAEPGKQQIIETELPKLQPKTGEEFTLSLSEEQAEALFADWEELYNPEPEDAATRDPAVTANGNPDAGSNILAPAAGDAGFYPTVFYPTAGDGGMLTVTGAASGTATVSARWAMDKSVKADCEVKMEGARALIEAAAASAGGSTLGGKSGYPYRLDLTAEPEETITLTFTPRLFGVKAGADGKFGGTYTWKVVRTEEDGSRTTLTETDQVETTTSPDENGGKWEYPLTDNRSGNKYTVTLTYEKDGERSVDYMTFTVYRAADMDDDEYAHIVLQERNAGQPIPNEVNAPAGQVEQIAVPDTEYAHANQITLEGYVSGAGNTRVRWWAKLKPEEDWKPVTGEVGSQTVRDAAGEARATVEWVSADLTLSTDGKTPTGGSIRVTGLDADVYGKDSFPVYLKAEAAEADGKGNFPSYRTVTVNVMPKLEITPKTKTVVFSSFFQQSCDFSVNRSDAGTYDYIWTTTVNGKITSSKIGSAVETINGVVDETVMVTCTYGPFSETASYKWRRLLDTLTAPINADYIDDAGKEYFIIEKGKSREVEFTWGSLASYSITTEPSGTVGGIEIGSNPGGSKEPNRVQAGLISRAYVGERTYQMTGREYTGSEPQELEWRLTDWGTETFPKYFAVVGMEIDGENHLLLKKGGSGQLTATWSFPDVLKATKEDPETGESVYKERLRWISDHPELVEVNEETGALTAVKNGSATITATYTVECVNGKVYTFHDAVSVEVRPDGTLTVNLQPCTREDVDALNAAFGDGLTADSVLVPVDGSGCWTLIRDESFHLNTLYLKATAELDGVPVKELLTDYFSNVSGDRFYLDIDVPTEEFYQAEPERLSTQYIRVRAKAANAAVTHVDLTSEIGTDKNTQTIYIYDAPEVRLMWKDETGREVDVTNGSNPVYLDDTDLDVALTAQLDPVLYSAADRSRPLDTTAWEVRSPEEGYDPGRYLDWTVDRETIHIWLQSGEHMPDFRVVLHAYSRTAGTDGAAEAGYALVFLPEKKGQP